MKALLPENVPLPWVLPKLPWSKKYLYNLKWKKEIDFLVNTDGRGAPSKRLRVILPKLDAFLRQRGLLEVLEKVNSRVRKLIETSDGPEGLT